MVLDPMKGVWKSVRARPGELCVMMDGQLLMPTWLADNLAILALVITAIYILESVDSICSVDA